ncbi:MAG: hypothetical protein JHC95_01470 [Solirubrobacteraceae bacterium]|nr:hypothetical protein [Solirubrobacteraceae bacterium]
MAKRIVLLAAVAGALFVAGALVVMNTRDEACPDAIDSSAWLTDRAAEAERIDRCGLATAKTATEIRGVLGNEDVRANSDPAAEYMLMWQLGSQPDPHLTVEIERGRVRDAYVSEGS